MAKAKTYNFELFDIGGRVICNFNCSAEEKIEAEIAAVRKADEICACAIQYKDGKSPSIVTESQYQAIKAKEKLSVS